jgi:hypothetical protein
MQRIIRHIGHWPPRIVLENAVVSLETNATFSDEEMQAADRVLRKLTLVISDQNVPELQFHARLSQLVVNSPPEESE